MDPIDFHATTIVAADGCRLTAREYPAAGVPVGAVLIVSAMAVQQSVHADFAQWLAGQGWQVVTFDYRGMGESAPRTLRGFKADILTWAREDCAAALAIARGLAPGRSLVWIGHSLGGQILAREPSSGIRGRRRGPARLEMRRMRRINWGFGVSDISDSFASAPVTGSGLGCSTGLSGPSVTEPVSHRPLAAVETSS